MKSVLWWCEELRKHDAAKCGSAAPDINERGNTLYRGWAELERYVIDSGDEFAAEGWQQFDTDQDASYFGVWVNPSRRLVLSYTEGDWCLVECPDDPHYNAEVRSMCEFYGEGRIALVIDANGSATEFRQDRATFLKP